MNPSEALRMAWQALTTNKLRAALTVLGISVGIFSIIAAMTAVAALETSLSENSSQLGGNVFQMQKYPAQNFGPGNRDKFRNRRDLTYEQLAIVKERATLPVMTGIEVWPAFDGIIQSGREKTNPNVQISGGDEGFAPNNNYAIAEGREISPSDVGSARHVIVLGMDVVDKLFPNVPAVGQTVRVSGAPFEVIGIYEAKGSQFGNSQDNLVTLPVTTALSLYGAEGRSLNLTVRAADAARMEATQDEIIGLLRTVRKVPPGEDSDFEMFSNDSVMETFGRLTSMVTMVALPIALISLIAAGIGIMNIMLVSVTERTKEIGTRKALGATRRNLVLQFLLEAVTLCLMGGVLGTLAGVSVGNVLSIFLGSTPVFPIGWAIFGLVACSLIGLTFGLYPAYKAAKLDPIVALRYE